MAEFNKTLQQVVGYTSLLGGLFGNKNNQPLQTQQEYKSVSDSVRSSIRTYGVQKTSMAHVFFPTLPKVLSSPGNSTLMAGAKMLSLATYRADSFTQPGMSIATSEVRRYGVGPVEKKPYAAIMTDVNMSFIGDSDGALHKFFYMWINSIVNATDLPRGGQQKLSGAYPHEVQYKEDYKMNSIDIYTYNEAQFKVGVFKLYNAFPIFLGEVQRNWADSDQLVRIPVTFTFSHWSYDETTLSATVEPTLYGQQRDTSLSLYNSIMKTATILQAISSTKRPQNINDVLNVVNSGSTILKSLFPSSPKVEYTDYYTKTQTFG